ncbi:hypothetical protein FB45DRAFT_873846 [Roridomyces roridus]|uniref:Uncharacterized protein n=1 Tax=Roridomyces roridus TaxID=1738132 RepID=A0AAD7BAE8_9AGAR|nr:hypothetical protein FB45DRAFT_873846 [Roridomyces roridus]
MKRLETNEQREWPTHKHLCAREGLPNAPELPVSSPPQQNTSAAGLELDKQPDPTQSDGQRSVELWETSFKRDTQLSASCEALSSGLRKSISVGFSLGALQKPVRDRREAGTKPYIRLAERGPSISRRRGSEELESEELLFSPLTSMRAPLPLYCGVGTKSARTRHALFRKPSSWPSDCRVDNLRGRSGRWQTSGHSPSSSRENLQEASSLPALRSPPLAFCQTVIRGPLLAAGVVMPMFGSEPIRTCANPEPNLNSGPGFGQLRFSPHITGVPKWSRNTTDHWHNVDFDGEIRFSSETARMICLCFSSLTLRPLLASAAAVEGRILHSILCRALAAWTRGVELHVEMLLIRASPYREHFSNRRSSNYLAAFDISAEPCCLCFYSVTALLVPLFWNTSSPIPGKPLAKSCSVPL